MTSPQELRLPLDQLTFSLREKHSGLLDMAILGTSGGSGLARLARGDNLSESIRNQMEYGSKFVGEVLLDVERCERGVNVLKRIFYDPREVVTEAARIYFNLGVTSENSQEVALEKMRELAEKFSQVFTDILGGKEFNESEIVELLREFRHLSNPYINVSTRIHSEWLREVAAPPRF